MDPPPYLLIGPLLTRVLKPGEEDSLGVSLVRGQRAPVLVGENATSLGASSYGFDKSIDKKIVKRHNLEYVR